MVTERGRVSEATKGLPPAVNEGFPIVDGMKR
jgi:hypothetical protein